MLWIVLLYDEILELQAVSLSLMRMPHFLSTINMVYFKLTAKLLLFEPDYLMESECALLGGLDVLNRYLHF